MGSILLKSGTLIFLIVLGYFLKRVGLFQQSDSKLLAKIMLYVTLPAILINAFRDFVPDIRLLVFSVVGLAANIIMSAVGCTSARRPTATAQRPSSPKCSFALAVRCFRRRTVSPP